MVALNWTKISIRMETRFLYSCWRRIRSTNIIKGSQQPLDGGRRSADAIRGREFDIAAARRKKTRETPEGIKIEAKAAA